jgi:tight adherence protein C
MNPAFLSVRLGAISGLTCSIWILVYALAERPAYEASLLGMRGLKRQHAKADPLWSRVEPLVSWLAARVRPMLGQKFCEKLDRQLVLAGDFLGVTPAEYVALSMLSCVLGFLAGALMARLTHMGMLIVLSFGLVGGALPYLHLTGRASERMKLIRRELPHAIDLIALGMSAGLDFPGSIRQLVDKSSDSSHPLNEELGWMMQKLRVGHTRKQVVQEFADRVPVDEVVEFAASIAQAEERGNPLAAVLEIQATTSRERRSSLAEQSAAKASVALTAPLMLMFLCIMLLVVAPIIIRLGHSTIFGG